jgi:6-pyruvoyltetrahydropterin/6-carboxytetrahydropterin synthase
MPVPRVAVFRKAHFNAAHRLHNPAWSDEKNVAVFGLCNNANWHGHNYELEVKVTGEIDADTGMVVDLGWLANLIKTDIEKKFDHKNLNLDTQEFKNIIPTAENISVVIWNILRQKLPDNLDLHIRLYETPRNFVEFPA